MPLYEYYCDNCRREVAVTLSIGQHDKGVPACPQCSGKRPSSFREYGLFSDVPEVLSRGIAAVRHPSVESPSALVVSRPPHRSC
jgi:putative FmdB family regulatory protein